MRRTARTLQSTQRMPVSIYIYRDIHIYICVYLILVSTHVYAYVHVYACVCVRCIASYNHRLNSWTPTRCIHSSVCTGAAYACKRDNNYAHTYRKLSFDAVPKKAHGSAVATTVDPRHVAGNACSCAETTYSEIIYSILSRNVRIFVYRENTPSPLPEQSRNYEIFEMYIEFDKLFINYLLIMNYLLII